MNLTRHPELIHPTAYVAPRATVLGEVHLGPHASIWFGCVVRGDSAPITIGARTNVQDLTVLHADSAHPCTLGREVTVGHRAVVHGATVADGVLVGIGAIVLNGAVIERGAIIGAGAVVPEGMRVPAEHLALGTPARVVRPLDAEEIRRTREIAAHYVQRARAFMALE
jgi:carbonic anhydrase/acetyltransferase-like protein (isoleucine patch superfamily)